MRGHPAVIEFEAMEAAQGGGVLVLPAAGKASLDRLEGKGFLGQLEPRAADALGRVERGNQRDVERARASQARSGRRGAAGVEFACT